MPNPAAFDGYVEQMARVTATSLIHYQRNPLQRAVRVAHTSVSVRAYPDRLVVVGPSADEAGTARHPASQLRAWSDLVRLAPLRQLAATQSPAPCAMALRSKPCPSPCSIFRLICCVTQVVIA